MFVFKHLTVNE